MKCYRIKEWQRHFENNRSRELKSLDWVPVKNKMDGDGYTELLDHPNGAAHFGAWMAIVQVASKCDERGTLMREGARPHDSASLSRLTRIPRAVFDEVLPRLVSIGWLELLNIDNQVVTEIPQDDATPPHDDAEKCLRNRTEQNRREEKNTEEKNTSHFHASEPSLIPETPQDQTETRPPKRARAPNPIWDVVKELFYRDGIPNSQNAAVAKIVHDFESVRATPDEIRTRYERYRKGWPNIAHTARGLVYNWSQFGPGCAVGSAPSQSAHGAGGAAAASNIRRRSGEYNEDTSANLPISRVGSVT